LDSSTIWRIFIGDSRRALLTRLGEEKVIAAVSVHLLTDLAKTEMKEDNFLLDEIRLEE
jgi:hypothetical protein